MSIQTTDFYFQLNFSLVFFLMRIVTFIFVVRSYHYFWEIFGTFTALCNPEDIGQYKITWFTWPYKIDDFVYDTITPINRAIKMYCLWLWIIYASMTRPLVLHIRRDIANSRYTQRELISPNLINFLVLFYFSTQPSKSQLVQWL